MSRSSVRRGLQVRSFPDPPSRAEAPPAADPRASAPQVQSRDRRAVVFSEFKDGLYFLAFNKGVLVICSAFKGVLVFF